jgi:hypothetical protein
VQPAPLPTKSRKVGGFGYTITVAIESQRRYFEFTFGLFGFFDSYIYVGHFVLLAMCFICYFFLCEQTIFHNSMYIIGCEFHFSLLYERVVVLMKKV